MTNADLPRSASVRGAFVRVAVFWLAYVAVLLVVGAARSFVPTPFGPLLWGVLSSAVLIALTRAREARDADLPAQVGSGWERATPLRFLAGLVLGAAVYGLTLVAISWLAGPLELVRAPTPAVPAVALTALTTLALATMEELGFRGYPLWILVPSIGRWRAQVCVAVAFALSHLLYGWPWQTVLLGVLPCAVLFGAAALASGGLALPIGVHFGLNAARWAAGETDASGIWTMSVAEPLLERVGVVAPVVGAAIPLLASAALWGWTARVRSRT